MVNFFTDLDHSMGENAATKEKDMAKYKDVFYCSYIPSQNICMPTTNYTHYHHHNSIQNRIPTLVHKNLHQTPNNIRMTKYPNVPRAAALLKAGDHAKTKLSFLIIELNGLL